MENMVPGPSPLADVPGFVKRSYSGSAVLKTRSTQNPQYSKTAVLKIFLQKNVDNCQIILQEACTTRTSG